MFTRTRRLIEIISTIAYYRIDQIIFPWYFRFSYLIFWNKHPARYATRANRMYDACCSLGPLFIKLGQLISIRHDLFPQDITDSLTKLQDRVPPESFKYITNSIEKELGKPIDQLFTYIDPKPLGAASIAQVHTATLKNGEVVAVKVLRPNIQQTIQTDTKLLRLLSGFVFETKIANDLINAYEHSLSLETNLRQEGSHYSQIKHNFIDDERLYVPKVYWSYTNRNILTTEKITAINIRDIAQHPHVDRKKLAENGLEIFFTQVFQHRFFHADMHPGNVLVDISNPLAPKYIAIDFGIIGIISENDQYFLIECFLALYLRNYTRIAQLHIEAGWVGDATDITHFENALRGVCEPIFSLPIAQISIAELMQQVVTASRQFKLHIQPQLLMLQKTLFHVEAMGRELYPELNVLKASEPFINHFVKKRGGLRHGWKKLQTEMPRLFLQAPEIPALLHQHLSQPKPPAPIKKSPLPIFASSMALGALISAPYKLTKPGVIYIITNIIIIMVTWKKLRPKDFV